MTLPWIWSCGWSGASALGLAPSGSVSGLGRPARGEADRARREAQGSMTGQVSSDRGHGAPSAAYAGGRRLTDRTAHGDQCG